MIDYKQAYSRASEKMHYMLAELKEPMNILSDRDKHLIDSALWGMYNVMKEAKK